MQQDRRDDKTVANDASLHPPVLSARKPIWSRWPRGLAALAVLALGWVGIYLLWHGVVFLFTL
jgi:hypothetical protein